MSCFSIGFCLILGIGVLVYAAIGSYLIWVAVHLTIRKKIDRRVENNMSAICFFVSGCIFLIPLAQVLIRVLLACWETANSLFRKNKVSPSPTSSAEDGSSLW